MKFRPYLTRLIARLPLLRTLTALTLMLAAMPTQVGPGIGNNNNPEELPDTIDMNHMRVLDIESAGFQTLKHGLDSPSFLICREGFLRAAEGNEDLRFRLSSLVLDNGTGQIAEFSIHRHDRYGTGRVPLHV